MKIVFKIMMVVVVASMPTTARADRRPWAFTYPYMTQQEGALELEYYNTQSRSVFGDGAVSTMTQQVELEYGITDHTDVSLYQVFEEVGDSGLHYKETKVRARHRFGERGQGPVDVLLYGEVIKPFGVGALAFEPKLILSRDFGKLTAAVNLIAEIELERELEASGEKELEAELEAGWAAGLTYEVAPSFNIGGELWGAVVQLGRDAQFTEAWAGPTLAWAPSPKLWVTSTAGIGFTDQSDSFVVRFLIGIYL